MSRTRAPVASHQQALHIVKHLLGSGRLSSILKVVMVLVAIGWFGDSVFEWLDDIGKLLKGNSADIQDWWPLHRLFAVAFIAGIIGRLWWLARQAEAHVRPRVLVDSKPSQVEGLILYLSALQQEDFAQLQALSPGLNGMDAFCQGFAKLNWRMPLKAIDYHLPRLRRVLVISSAHAGGSRKQFTVFRGLVAQIFPDVDLQVEDVAGLDSRYEPGIDFNDVEKVAAATDDAYVHLREAGLKPDQILIDITGGYKTSSIAGAAVALAEGRRIQYVSNDYQVLAYDVTYDH